MLDVLTRLTSAPSDFVAVICIGTVACPEVIRSFAVGTASVFTVTVSDSGIIITVSVAIAIPLIV